MYQVPPHQSPSTVRPIAALVLVLVLLLVVVLSLTDVRQGNGDPFQQPPQAPVGLGL